MRIGFVKVSSAAIAPTMGSPDAAGFNLYSVKNALVPPAMVKLTHTDIR